MLDPANAELISNSDSKSGQLMWRLREGGIVLKCVVSVVVHRNIDFNSAFIY
jgi:hypothetical protein